MVKKKQILFNSKERKDLQSVAAFLRELADKMEENQVTLRQGEDETPLVFPNNVVMDIKVERKVKPHKNRYKFEIEIKWLEGDTLGGVRLG